MTSSLALLAAKGAGFITIGKIAIALNLNFFIETPPFSFGLELFWTSALVNS
jgi:hypothetical protein